MCDWDLCMRSRETFTTISLASAPFDGLGQAGHSRPGFIIGKRGHSI